MPEVFEQYPVAAWKLSNQRELRFPVISINEQGSNRIVERNRPYRDGAKLDDVGSNSIRWTIEAIFENSIEEEGLDFTTPLYPDVMNNLIDSFRIHETGDLTLPTRGVVRARIESYTRTESDVERDFAKVSMVFCEDNEDSIDAHKFTALEANASMKRVTEAAVFDALSIGAWNTSLSDLREFGSELEGIMNFPGDTLDDIDSRAAIVVSTVNSVLRTFTSPHGSERLKDPESSSAQRKLEQTKDIAFRATAESRAGRPSMTAYRVIEDTDIFAIAADLGQYPAALLDINPGIDALNITAGSVINVFE